MANDNLHHHDHCRQKWPPSVTQKATNPAPTRWIDRRQSPEQADILFSCNERVYDPQSAPMARQDSSPSSPHHRSILKAIDPLIVREKHICLLGDHPLLIRHACTQNLTSCAAVGGHFWRRRPWLWRLLISSGMLVFLVERQKIIRNPAYKASLLFRWIMNGR